MDENNIENFDSQSMIKEELPEGKPALTYGIIGNALGTLFFIPYIGILATILGIIISIIALSKGKAGLYNYKGNGHKYIQGTFAQSLIGMILGINGIAGGFVFFLYSLVFTFLVNAPHHYSHHYYY
jgi:hypothetical protein